MTPQRKATRQKSTPQRTGEFAWRPAFIAALRQHGNVTAAADHAGINRTTAYRLRDANKEFEAEWDAALLEAADRIEFEALRRAKRGVLKPIYYQGKRVGYEREYSDTLMGMMLKGHKPDKYGDKITIKIKPEWIAVFDEAGKSASDILEDFVQRYAKARTEANNAS